MIDRNMKWNDYPSCTLYLWNGDVLYTVSEGTGDNLLAEDVEEGYVDYWLVDINSLYEDIPQGGQWMETELIHDIDYTLQGVIDRMGECDLWEDDWKIIDPEIGEQLQNNFEHWYVSRAKAKMAKRNIEELIVKLEGEQK